MKKTKIFEEPQNIINTPMLDNEDCSSIAYVDVFLNEYGNVVVSATNHDGGTGYFSSSLEDIFRPLDKNVLTFLLNSLQIVLEYKRETDKKPSQGFPPETIKIESEGNKND